MWALGSVWVRWPLVSRSRARNDVNQNLAREIGEARNRRAGREIVGRSQPVRVIADGRQIQACGRAPVRRVI